MDLAKLPRGWDSPTPIAATQILGDRWIASATAAVLKVPSAITEGESNYLCNPAHPDFAKLKMGKPQKFRLDPRI